MFTNRIRTAEQLICQRGLFFAALMKVENRYRSLLMALEDWGGRLGYYTENENKNAEFILNRHYITFRQTRAGEHRCR